MLPSFIEENKFFLGTAFYLSVISNMRQNLNSATTSLNKILGLFLCVSASEACCHFAPPTAVKCFCSLGNMVSAYLRHFMTKIWLFLSFSALASKFQLSLIVNNLVQSKNPNRFQREFLFNNHICSQNRISCLSQCLKKTNLFKRTTIQMSL
jgi:hypothetical protein